MMTINRLGLLVYFNPQLLHPFHPDLFYGFWVGLRFDLSLLSYFTLLSFLLVLLLRNEKILRSVLIAYWLIVVTAIAILFAIDYGFYSFFQDHINIMFFGFFKDDTWALIRTFWKNYPFVSIIVCVLIFIFFVYVGLKKYFSRLQLESLRSGRSLFIAIATILVLSLTARGSLGLFPLSNQDTVISNESFINFLAFNAGHSFYRASRLFKDQNKKWNMNAETYGYSNLQTAISDYRKTSFGDAPSKISVGQSPFQQMLRKTSLTSTKNSPHVVVIIMESFGSYWIKYNSEKFDLLGPLKKHFEQDSLLLNSLPNAGSTIGTLSSFMMGFPQRVQGPFLTESEHLNSAFPSGIGNPYLKNGYQTRFVYGGNPGWRDINKYALKQGFQTVEGAVEIKNQMSESQRKNFEEHDWGIYDEDLFEYVFNQLKTATKPQFILVMTTTNHPPYQLPQHSKLTEWNDPSIRKELIIPESLKNQLIVGSDLASNRFAVYQYASFGLSHFLDEIKKDADLGEKTYVSVSGDHNFWIINFDEKQFLDKWGVPIYFYLPGKMNLHIPTDRFASQLDIMPTLYELTLPSTTYLSSGLNLLDANANFGSINAGAIAINTDGAIFSLSRDSTHYFRWNDGHLVAADAKESLKQLEIRYKSLMSMTDYYLKYFNEIKIDN